MIKQPANSVVLLRAAMLAGALGLFAWRVLDTARVYNHTFDEPTQIASGMELLQYGTFEMHIDAPPLAKVLAAAPVWLGGARLAAPPRRGYFDDATRFLYDQAAYWPALRAARGVEAFIGVLLLAALYAVALRWFGSAGAVATVWAASISPGLVSASSIANSDILGVLTVLATLWCFRRLLEAPSMARAAFFGAALGLALLAKLSALPFLVFSLPVVAAFTLGWSALFPLRHPVAFWRDHAHELATAALLVPIVIWAGYGFHLAPVIGEGQAAAASASLRSRSPALASAIAALPGMSLPLGGFLRGLGSASAIARLGHPAYLMGHYSLHGWPHYFLVTLALKLPLGLLFASALAAVLAVLGRKTVEGKETLLALCIAAAIVASVARAGVNAGHRHVIVVEALLALVIGGGVALALQRTRGQRLWAGALTLGIASGAVASIRAHPDALGYTNALAGSRPDWWFVDSNLDWGQDLQRLSDWLRDNRVGEPLHLAYFGTAWPERHGLHPLPLLAGHRPSGWIAVSVQYERGLRDSAIGQLPDEAQRREFAWLLDLHEVVQIGTSIRVYHVDSPGPSPAN
jgi:hypothetical protein